MAWVKRSGAAEKYRTAEHRNRRAALVRDIKAGKYITCTARECLFSDRRITNTNGRDADGLHLGHNDDGITYAGPQHNRCNVKDGARRARQRQLVGPPTPANKPWLLRDYHPCPMCSTVVTWQSQRCCSNTCATAYRRAMSGKAPKRVSLTVLHTCAVCGDLTPTKTCSEPCRDEWNRRTTRDAYRSRKGLSVDHRQPSKSWKLFQFSDMRPA